MKNDFVPIVYHTGPYLTRGFETINYLSTRVFVLYLVGLFVDMAGNDVNTHLSQARKCESFCVSLLKFSLLFGFWIFFNFSNLQIKGHLRTRFLPNE